MRARLCVFVCAALFMRLNKFLCYCSLVKLLLALGNELSFAERRNNYLH